MKTQTASSISPLRLATGLAGILLVLLAAWQINAAGRGLAITRLQRDGVPMTLITPVAGAAERPLVLVGHGFAGSDVLMRGFALTLAHAGYSVISWDFDGHGANSRPASADGLLRDAELARAMATELNAWDGQRLAILGHSMGSGVALSFGQKYPETQATIAVSPVGTAVTPELPRNLLLMAGALEPAFLGNARERLAEAGGEGGDPAQGTARRLQVIPGVEHVSILFAPLAYTTARAWLDGVFGAQPGAQAYRDLRMVWYAVGVAGMLLAAMCLAPRPPQRVRADGRSPASTLRLLGALAGGAAGATLLLWLAGLAGLNLQGLFGILVGGYLLAWFGAAGVLALLLSGVRPGWPGWRALGAGLAVFAALWLGVGLLGQYTWLQWLLAPPRLALWLPGAALLVPWFLVFGQGASRAGWLGKTGWWLAHCAIIMTALFAALRLSPGLGFILLILPLFPIILALHGLASGPQRNAWVVALSGAGFVAWLLLAVFPLN